MSEREKIGKDSSRQRKGREGRRAEEKKRRVREQEKERKKQSKTITAYLLCMRTYGARLLTLVIIETMALSGCSPFESVRIISSPKSQKSCLGKEAKGVTLWTKQGAFQHSRYWDRSGDVHTTQEKK